MVNPGTSEKVAFPAPPVHLYAGTFYQIYSVLSSYPSFYRQARLSPYMLCVTISTH